MVCEKKYKKAFSSLHHSLHLYLPWAMSASSSCFYIYYLSSFQSNIDDSRGTSTKKKKKVKGKIIYISLFVLFNHLFTTGMFTCDES